MYATCLRCNRPLKDAGSQSLGLGPTCAKFGVPTGPKEDRFTIGLFPGLTAGMALVAVDQRARRETDFWSSQYQNA